MAPARIRPLAWQSRPRPRSSSAAAACTSPRSSSARRSRIATRASPRDFFASPDSRSISPSRSSTCRSNAGDRRTRLPTSLATTRSRWAPRPGLRAGRDASSSPCACTTPTARRQSSNRSRMSPSQNSIRTGRRRGALASSRSQYRSIPRYATVSGTPRSAHPHTCANAGPAIRTRWPPFFRQR